MKELLFKKTFFLALILLLACISSVSADTAINSTCVINTPGTYYLNSSIIDTGIGGTAITITCDDVVLDGNGYIINGTGTESYGIYARGPYTNITLKNLNITSFQYGIYLENVENSILKNNTASSNSICGIYLEYSSNNVLTNNTAHLNKDDDIYLKSSNIYLVSSNNNTITGNNVSLNSEYGIYLKNSDTNTITDNNASSNYYYGIYLDSSEGNTITNNTASSSNYGIVLSSSSNNNTITSNIITKNFQRGSIELLSSSYNTLINNTICLNNMGIRLSSSSNNNTITGNNVSSNNGSAIYLIDSSNNAITDNNVSSNKATGIYLDSSGTNTITENNVSSNTYGIHLDSSGTNTITDNTLTLNIWGGIYLYYSSDGKIINNTATLNGYDGIYILYSNNNTISGNTATLNDHNGINTYSSSDSNIINNNVSSNSWHGISLTYSSNNNSITNNTANSNRDGIYLVYSSNNTITDNDVISNIDRGISLSSSNNTIVHNSISLNPYGIYIGNYENNHIYHNIFNNTDNLFISSYSVMGTNYWNNSKENGGGNYWFTPTGTGFSEITPDWNNDGFCDDPNNLVENNTDYLPISWDKIPPEVTINAPLTEKEYPTGSISINVTVNDSLSNISSVTAEIENIKNISLALNESYYTGHTGNLSDGVYNISVTAVDLKGNANTTKPITVTVDTLNPKVTINHKEDDYNYSTNILNVTVTDASAVTVIAEINNGSVLQNITLENISGYFVNMTHEFVESEYTVKIYATDLAGNVNSSETVDFMVDWTAPVVSIETPLNGSYISFTDPKLNFTITDNVCESVVYNVTVNGNLVNSNEVNTSIQINSTLNLVEGENNISVVAIDDTRNTGENTTTVFVDTVNPEVVINNVVGPYNYNSSILNVTVTDTNLDSVLAEVNGLENITLNGSTGYFVTNKEFNEGPNTVKIYATDLAGNVNSTETVTFKVDLTDPVITVNTVEDSYSNNGSNVLNFTVDEDYIDSVTAFNGSTEITLENSTGNYLNSVELADGVYNVTITANDTASNEVSETVTFTVDTVNPEVVINNVVGPYNYNSSILNVTATDINLDSVVAEIDGLQNITLTQTNGYFVNSSYEFTEGLKTVRIYATDLAGNVNSSENVTFRVDLTDPVIIVNTVEDSYSNNGSNVLNFTVNEDYIDSVTAFNGSTEITLKNSTGDYLNANELADGIYNVTMTANDTASNEVSETVTFTVDTVNPEVVIVTPATGSRFRTSSTSITVTANDSLSNISSVTAQIGDTKTITLSKVGDYYTGTTGSLSDGNYEITVITTDRAGNVNSSETVDIIIDTPSSSSSSSDVSDDIESDAVRNAVSDSDVVYGNVFDEGYAQGLKENLFNADDYEIFGDTIIVGGPKSNVLAEKYNSEFEIPISNENPGEYTGVIQVIKVQDNSGKIIQSYSVIYIAGSDRLGTQAALEYFKTLDKIPDEPITVKWTANGPVVAE
ncbi:parallel beta-helix repeat protein [Methanococcus maripaludis]|uniref:Parallel beta-helix repeat protein n=1 Tax=Methanococcus maripaludis TaxID=39152 RepID=A0A7J9P567_METMI|nr:NosD domain-containing protein [Methanococcus maripaludis]MBA2858343.1 parallel beta-helix repeat protein [Methanococcus maripaludis]